MFKSQQELKSGSSFSAKDNNLVTTTVPQKRKMAKTASEKQPPSKKQKNTAPKHAEVSHADSTKNSQNTHEVKSIDKGEEITLTVAAETDANATRSTGDSKQRKSKPNVYTDQCTAYVSNLSLEASSISITRLSYGQSIT